jgi:hypothetical protein
MPSLKNKKDASAIRREAIEECEIEVQKLISALRGSTYPGSDNAREMLTSLAARIMRIGEPRRKKSPPLKTTNDSLEMLLARAALLAQAAKLTRDKRGGSLTHG